MDDLGVSRSVGFIAYLSKLLRSEIGGKKASAKPNREIGFGFVSCSCRACVRACVRACEAVWVCDRGAFERWWLGWQDLLRQWGALFHFSVQFRWVL